MASHPRLYSALALTALLSGASVGRAVELERLLLDDTDSVAVINVKQILAAAPVQKHYKELLPQLLAANADVQQVLKALGLDPLKDIDRIELIQGQGSYKLDSRIEKGRVQATRKGGPLVLIQGRFDPAKFPAFAEQAAGGNPAARVRIKLHKVNGTPVYEAVWPEADPVFVAVLDKFTVAASPVQDQVIEAVKKATADVRVALKAPQIKNLYETAAKTEGVAVAAIGNMVWSREIGTFTEPNGKTTVTTKQTTLAEALGLQSLAAELKIGAAVEARVTLLANGQDTASRLTQVLEMLRGQLLPAFPPESELAPVHDALKKAKIVTEKQTVRIEATGSEQLVALPLVWLTRLAPANR